MSSQIKLIVGLGNPGPQYSVTRHNAGFWFVDNLLAGSSESFSSESKFFSEISRLHDAGVDCRLMKPTTFMNASGRAVQAITDYYKLGAADILVAHDEIDLEPGAVRLKRGGGHGGHNGLRDIINCIDSRDFLRLRIGVGHPGNPEQVSDYVLARASRQEQALIDNAVDRVIAVMPLLFKGELQKAMNELHTDK